MSWLISVGNLAKNGAQAASTKNGGTAPLALYLASNSRHTSGQWSLVSGFAPASQAKQIWQGVLSDLVDN